MSYYDDNAKEYIDKTFNCDMQAQYNMLLEFVQEGKLLDVGFGSARDMLYFKSKGFDVYGIDPTEAFCKHAKELGLSVEQSTIENYKSDIRFDVIWACASLLHCRDLHKAFFNCYRLIKRGGVFYVSLKLGVGEEIVQNRFFHYVNQKELGGLLSEYRFIKLNEKITRDSLCNREVKWLNLLLKKE